MEFSREKESLLTMVVEQRLMIESLLLRVEKLEGATRDSSIVEEEPSMGVGMKVDDTPSMGDGKVIGRNPSKERTIGIKKARVEYGNRSVLPLPQERPYSIHLQQVEERP